MIKVFIAVLAHLFVYAPALVAQQSSVIILRGVSIVGLSGSEDQTGRDIVIEGGKIRSIVATSKAARNDAQIIDLTGRWIMPGLIDTRVHLAEKSLQWPQDEIEFRDLLACGVTTVLDVGGRLENVQEVAKRSAEAGWIGPRVLHCGSAFFGERLAQKDSAAQRFIFKNGKDVAAAVNQIKKSGAVGIMLECNLPAKIARAAIQTAQAKGMLVTAHPGVMSFGEAAASGVELIHGISSFATDFIGGGDREKLVKNKDTATTLLYAWEKVNPTRHGRQKIDKLTALGTFMAPSLAKDTRYLDYYAPSARSEQVQATRKKYVEVMRLAYQAGIPLIAGSDYSTNENDRVCIIDELRAWVEAGFESRVALEAATKNAAHPLRLAETVGQVDPGYVADLLVLAGNPAGDIRHLEKPVMVVRNGVAYPIEQLLTDEVRWRRDKRAIRAVLERQVIAWNEKDLRRFMQGYWQNDNLIFASGGEVMRGWQSALDRYLKNYDTAAKIGRLNFRIEQIDSLGDGWAKVFGEWEVTRAMEKLSGLFTLIMERQAEGWRIVHDHTSSAAK
jgi:ketosteroid isomerase-like protein